MSPFRKSVEDSVTVTFFGEVLAWEFACEMPDAAFSDILAKGELSLRRRRSRRKRTKGERYISKAYREAYAYRSRTVTSLRQIVRCAQGTVAAYLESEIRTGLCEIKAPDLES